MARSATESKSEERRLRGALLRQLVQSKGSSSQTIASKNALANPPSEAGSSPRHPDRLCLLWHYARDACCSQERCLHGLSKTMLRAIGYPHGKRRAPCVSVQARKAQSLTCYNKEGHCLALPAVLFSNAPL
jgi:hypothetical protein